MPNFKSSRITSFTASTFGTYLAVVGMRGALPRLRCIGKTDAQNAPSKSPDQAARRNNQFATRTSDVVPDSCMRHCRLRIIRMTSKPLIVAHSRGSEQIH